MTHTAGAQLGTGIGDREQSNPAPSQELALPTDPLSHLFANTHVLILNQLQERGNYKHDYS